MARDYAETIKGLLTKAENPAATEHEREALLAKAQELMTKYAIDEAMVAAARAKDGQPINFGNVTSRVWFRDDKYAMLIKARRELLFGLADINNVKTVMHGRSFVTAVGFESDLDNINMLFASIMIQLQTDMERDARTAVTSNMRTWRVSWSHGYVRRVIARLRAAKAGQMGAPGTALVLRDRSAVVATKLADLFPKLGKATMGTSVRDPWAYEAGDRAGTRADIGTKRFSGGDRTALGR